MINKMINVYLGYIMDNYMKYLLKITKLPNKI